MDLDRWFAQKSRRQFLADIYREELEEERRLTILGKSSRPKKPCSTRGSGNDGEIYHREKLEGF